MALDSVVTTLGNALIHIGTALRDYRSRAKIAVDSYADPALFALGANMAYLYGGDAVLDAVSRHTDAHEGLAIMGTYAALAAGFVVANRYIVAPIAGAVHRYHDRRYRSGREVTAASWMRTLMQASAVGAVLLSDQYQHTLAKYKHDAQRVVDAFSRRHSGEPLPVPARQRGDIQSTPERSETVLPAYPVKNNGGPQATGALCGRTLGGLFTRYTGIAGKVPPTADVNFNRQLDGLWASKRGRSGNDVVEQVYREQVVPYFNHKHSTMTLDQYLGEMRRSMQAVKTNLDWEEVQSTWNRLHPKKTLSGADLRLLRSISDSLDERDLMAYALTEIMPAKDGTVNKAVLDFLLRNAGREYVELLPALYDDKTSFGLYQFTEYALYERNGDLRGASVINAALPEQMRIRNSVRYLKGNDHHTAAYLFAICNLADLISGLDRMQFDVLQHAQARRMDIAKYIATAHHLPGNAQSAAKRWLDNGARNDFDISCSRSIRGYAEKTEANLRALYTREREEPCLAQPRLAEIHAETRPQAEQQTAPAPFTGRGKNRRGAFIFKYKGAAAPSEIAAKFNEWDAAQGDRFATAQPGSVVNNKGGFRGQRMYVLARSRT